MAVRLRDADHRPGGVRGRRQHVAFLGGPGIVYEEFAPPSELAPWVAVFWRIRSEVTFELRVPPDGCMDLIRRDVVGSLTRPLTATFRPGDTSEGVRFHPGGFPALFRIPANELVDVRLPIADVLPGFRSMRALAEGAPLPDPLARTAYHARDIRALRQATGYSERQLRRRVLAATGHGPKRLMRIARMQDVLRNGRSESWARTAAEYGYYDEAHMANDISALAGATPHALLGDRTASRLSHRDGRAWRQQWPFLPRQARQPLPRVNPYEVAVSGRAVNEEGTRS